MLCLRTKSTYSYVGILARGGGILFFALGGSRIPIYTNFNDYNFATANRIGSKQEVELAIIIIKRTEKVAIDGGLFSLRSGYAKWELISTQSTN